MESEIILHTFISLKLSSLYVFVTIPNFNMLRKSETWIQHETAITSCNSSKKVKTVVTGFSVLCQSPTECALNPGSALIPGKSIT